MHMEGAGFYPPGPCATDTTDRCVTPSPALCHSGCCGVSANATGTPARPKERGLYPDFPATPYPRFPAYFDVPAVARVCAGDSGQDARDGYQWSNWATTWESQLYCTKEPQTIWKASPAGSAVFSLSDSSTVYQRGRKKRVPYSKTQLKELEREYTLSKFITKDKRRLIASSTSLSERQVTIWFQNRRVKEKKVSAKLKDFQSYS
uniref:HOXD13x n=1 Tax=Pantodon buchholzi TaxID=8276 RepID=A0A088FSD2_PANBU|nr:HOXD13x [Pantodon buchholzi]